MAYLDSFKTFLTIYVDKAVFGNLNEFEREDLLSQICYAVHDAAGWDVFIDTDVKDFNQFVHSGPWTPHQDETAWLAVQNAVRRYYRVA